MKRFKNLNFLSFLAIVFVTSICLSSQSIASMIGLGLGGMFGSKESTFLSTLTNTEAIWEADYGTVQDVGIKLWTDQTNTYTQDKLNPVEQPAKITSSNFNGKNVLDFNATQSQSMDAAPFANMTSKNMMTIFMVLEHDSSSTTAVLAEISNGANANSVCNITTISSGQIRARCKNAANAWISANWITPTNFSATTLALVYDGRNATGNIKLYQCNTQKAVATDATGGFYSTSNRVFTMEAANDSLQADGKVAAYIVDDDAWSTSTLANAVALAKYKYGVCN